MAKRHLLTVALTLAACSAEPPIVAALPATARNIRQHQGLTPPTSHGTLALYRLEADLTEGECLSFLTGYAPREGLIRSNSAAVWHRRGDEAVVASCVGGRLLYRRLSR
ncbi:MAG: hypothetical protein IPJ34_05345 [Myxococcales bacterium]|nr:hypothetical protein [Myxococcales bacterium]